MDGVVTFGMIGPSHLMDSGVAALGCRSPWVPAAPCFSGGGQAASVADVASAPTSSAAATKARAAAEW